MMGRGVLSTHICVYFLCAVFFDKNCGGWFKSSWRSTHVSLLDATGGIFLGGCSISIFKPPKMLKVGW